MRSAGGVVLIVAGLVGLAFARDIVEAALVALVLVGGLLMLGPCRRGS
jgi:hypothetical protein